MYTYRQLPATIDGIESLNFAAYWAAIKERIEELRQLPTWATNHAMKLGITVTNLRNKGLHAQADAMALEGRKVNDDIAKAWKVKGYIDRYLPEWMSVSQKAAGSGAPIVPSQTPGVYVAPTTTQEVTGWLKSIVGLNGLGIAPLIPLSIAAMAGLTYTVTVGMSLWQDYRFKKDLTQSVIEGKVSAGQMAEIVTAARPPETLLEKVTTQAGGNLATIAVLGGIGYLAFMYLTSRKAVA